MTEVASSRPLEAVVEALCRSASEPTPLLQAFARAYVRRIPSDYLELLSEEEMCAQIEGFLDFARVRKGREVLVRAFNPSRATHGYERPGAVVEMVAPDAPFLVDSVTMALTGGGYTVEALIHPVIGATRTPEGELVELRPARDSGLRESVQHYQLDRLLSSEEAANVEEVVTRVIGDVRRATDDFEPMQGAVYRMMKVARQGTARYAHDEIEETVDFLEWLLDDNFVFLGYREYEIVDTPDGRAVQAAPHSGLGLLADTEESQFRHPVLLEELNPALRRRYEVGDLVVVTKTNSYSRVHRRARMDYIGVRRVDEDGRVSGEARLIGLFTSKAYMQAAESVPLLRRRLAQILADEDAIAGSHHYKQVVQLFNTVPKNELFSTPTEDIRDSIVGLIEAQERENIRLFVRRDLLQRNVSVLVVLPRDRFNAELRKGLQTLMLERLGGSSIDYQLALGESDTARIHFTVWITGEDVPSVNVEDLEAEVINMARTWEERLSEALADTFGDDRGEDLSNRWAASFPEAYRTSVPLEVAVTDVERLEQLASGVSPVVGVRPATEQEEPRTQISIFKDNGRLELSEIMPTLEHFGLRVIDEVPTELEESAAGIHIHDFGVLRTDGTPLDVEQCGERVAATITAVLQGRAESDSLDRLIIDADIDHRDVAILRAYRTYWQRVASDFTAPYMNDALAAQPHIANNLVKLFNARFDPESADAEREAAIAAAIVADLDRVESLDEDRILRGFLNLIKATVRTSAFRPDRESLSFKFISADVPGMPRPVPLFEIFVYAPGVEGVHLRGGRVARGGIRWSVRREDYRTEVLGLMKAQMTKNAVIVPTGAKGGFVLRGADRRPSLEEVRAAYITFIRGLLDVTDNRVGDVVVHPEHVVVQDGDDPYLVVAADKGTATFSDTANEIAAEYGFWLGDAFASGGSAGYDHKQLGITARGAWESVRWHLRDIDINPDTGDFTVVGIGDMSGDVFGNGMVLSQHIQLIAAFDHRHVFIDPNPDPDTGWAERSRLFELTGSSWDDYDRDKISAGGGVWPRSAKSIDLSQEARDALGTDLTAGTPDEVIRAILQAEVHLLWNGGVGTFVKASGESNAEVGDRVNDGIRVDAVALRCQAVGEGGNLGFTQRGRIEFAASGGRIFTDFIDNSGGVHCSDREVNLKILLGIAIERGQLDRDDRNQLVQHVAPDVVDAILYENFLQAQILSQEADRSATRLEAYEDLMSQLEREQLLDRRLERLPSAEVLRERAQAGEGLLRPELATLLTYAKRSLINQILASRIPDDPAFDDELANYFPAEVVQRFGDVIPEHPLRRELVATQVANRVIDSEGITFVSRLVAETASTPQDVVRAYRVARIISDAEERWKAVEDLVGSVKPGLQRELLAGIDRLVEELTRWQLIHHDRKSVEDRIDLFHPGFRELAQGIREVGPSAWRDARESERDALAATGVPDHVAASHTYQLDLEHGFDMVEVADATKQPVLDVARVFLQVGSALQLDWLEEQVTAMPVSSQWQRQALRVITDDLVALRRRFAEDVLATADGRPASEALDHYLADRTAAVGQLARFFRSLTVEGAPEISSLIVAIRRVEQLRRGYDSLADDD